MLIQEIDWRNPFDAFAPLAGDPNAHLFHGGDLSTKANWSIIVAFPADIITADASASNPFPEIDRLLKERRRDRETGGPQFPFMSGLLGFIGYEAARHFESGLSLPAPPYKAPELLLGVYDAAALFSRSERRAFVTGRDEKACRKLRDALGGLDSSEVHEQAPFSSVRSNVTASQYKAAVSEVVENILEGDYYQANISHRICASSGDVDAFSLFRTLAARSDAAFGALLQYPGGAVVSNSPERFFQISPYKKGRRKIVAEPIKGTRRRGGTAAQDRRLAHELVNDRKDRAENIMIADLLRNDLSKICRDGSLREDAICELMSLANVHHLVSRISGELREDASISDVFAALFPCGSITGAPKVEAMKAIARIEKTGRGPYCGAVGYIDDSGAADFSVSIRTMIVEGEGVAIPVGGGVTLRSDPTSEYEETILKAGGALAALKLSPEALL